MRPWIAVLLVAGACGRIDFDPLSATPDPDGTVSGARLKLRWNVYEDGARQRVGQYDSLRAENCEIQDLGDGTFACLPNALPRYFGDASCTEPVGYRQVCAPIPGYVLDTSGPRARIFERGAARASGFIYSTSPVTGCVIQAADVAYDLGPEVPLAAFAALDHITTAGGRIAAQAFQSSDGFQRADLPYDTELAVPCSPDIQDGNTVCGPSEDTSFASYASDAACTSRVTSGMPSQPPRYARWSPDQHCDFGDAHYFRTTGAAPLPTYEWADHVGCYAGGTFPMNQSPFAVDSTEAPVAPLARVVGTDPAHRLQTVDNVFETLRYRLEGELQDSIHGRCTAKITTDGVMRCVPDAEQINQYFDDAGCTQQILLAYTYGTTPCGAPAPKAFAQTLTTLGCAFPPTIFERGPLHSSPVYAGTPGNCGPATMLFPGVTTYYEVGSQLPPEAFLAATEVVDP